MRAAHLVKCIGLLRYYTNAPSVCFTMSPLLQTVALWDLRNLKLKLHSFESHKDEIFQVI